MADTFYLPLLMHFPIGRVLFFFSVRKKKVLTNGGTAAALIAKAQMFQSIAPTAVLKAMMMFLT